MEVRLMMPQVTEHRAAAVRDEKGRGERRKNERVRAALATAAGRVCPVWDVKSFIAANSLQGFEGLHFREAVRAARAYFHADALMPLGFYLEQKRAGRISAEDVVRTASVA